MAALNTSTLKPMLIGKESAPFSDPNWIFELKLDGCRCLAFVKPPFVELRNKRQIRLGSRFPELKEIGKQVKKSCVLDGELYVFQAGRPDFFELQRRTQTSDPFRIRLLANDHPATFTAFDLLAVEGKSVMTLPLMERKKRLDELIEENARINVSRYVKQQGEALFELTVQQGLEGIVAKRRDSLYYPDRRTTDWIKCKNLQDDDFVVTGYIEKGKGVVSLVLGQYQKRRLRYCGHVTLGVTAKPMLRLAKKTLRCPFDSLPPGNESAVWLDSPLVATVKFMERGAQGALRQPVFKGFREDKRPRDCVFLGLDKK